MARGCGFRITNICDRGDFAHTDILDWLTELKGQAQGEIRSQGGDAELGAASEGAG